MIRQQTAQRKSGARPFAERPDDLIWRLNVGQYHAMIESGILTDDDPVELLEGWLVYKIPKNPRHSFTTRVLRKLLERVLSPGWYVDSQEPVTVIDSEPEPDIFVMRGDEHDFAKRHPGAQDIVLIVEVSDTTLGRDRGRKKHLYARAGIPIYWIVNLIDTVIEVYTNPNGSSRPSDYQVRQEYWIGDLLPVVIDGLLVARLEVAEILSSADGRK